jgi:hypothetical protein
MRFPCHPERSLPVPFAKRLAESKDPVLAAVFTGLSRNSHNNLCVPLCPLWFENSTFTFSAPQSPRTLFDTPLAHSCISADSLWHRTR